MAYIVMAYIVMAYKQEERHPTSRPVEPTISAGANIDGTLGPIGAVESKYPAPSFAVYSISETPRSHTAPTIA